MTMTLATLQTVLEAYPDRLQHALTRQYRATTEFKRIKEQIEEAEDNSDSEDDSEDDTEVEIERLRANYDQKKAQLALEVRQNPQKYGIARPTDKAVNEVVQADKDLSTIKEQLQQRQRKRMEGFRSTLATRSHYRGREPKTTDSKLMAKLHEAEEESANADIEVRVLKETLDTYRMLTVILVGAKPVVNTLDIG